MGGGESESASGSGVGDSDLEAGRGGEAVKEVGAVVERERNVPALCNSDGVEGLVRRFDGNRRIEEVEANRDGEAIGVRSSDGDAPLCNLSNEAGCGAASFRVATLRDMVEIAPVRKLRRLS